MDQAVTMHAERVTSCKVLMENGIIDDVVALVIVISTRTRSLRW